MKNLKIIITLLIFSITTSTNAQFFKKLAKKAEEKIEREAERRAQRRVDRKIDKTFDKAENKIDETASGKNKKTTQESSNSDTSQKTDDSFNIQIQNVESKQTQFQFSHVYGLQFKTGKKKPITFEYYLKNNVNYIASVFPDMKNEMITILDLENGITNILMKNGNDKTRMTMKFDFKKAKEEAEEGIEITKTGNTKKILGYNCEEYIVKGDEFNSNVWVTNEASISFPNNFSGSGNKKMKNQNNNWMYKMNGMVLEMVMTDTSKKKPKTSTMTCVKLAKEPHTIDITTYKKLM